MVHADAPAQMALASASGFSLASASSPQVPGREQVVPLVTTVKTLSIRRPIGDAPEPEAERPIVTASFGKYQAREPAYEQQMAGGAADRSGDEPCRAAGSAAAAHQRATPDELNLYLWEVYQRQPVKKDRGGDFSWKDPAAANRMGKTLQAYVVLGMDADFREIVYHAGKAMDAAGIEWTIVSGFRDDWRQSIASGIKARTGYSRHGGSIAVGGYGHGRAVDIGHVDSAAQRRGVALARRQRREIRVASSISLSIRRMSSRASSGAGWRRSSAASAPAAWRLPRPRDA